MRKRRQLFGVQAPEIADIAGRDAKDVVALARNQEQASTCGIFAAAASNSASISAA